MVDVRLCHACHAKRRWMWGCSTPATQNAAASRASRATKPVQARHPVHECHACHAKRRWIWDCATPATQKRWMWGCATPATQSAAASRASWATKPVQARHPVPSVPRLPGKTTVDVSLCHACHAKRRWMWGCATPATQSAAASRASRATKPVQARHPVPWVPRLPRKTTVDVSLCHACHVKRRWMWGCARHATQSMLSLCVWS